MTRRLLVVVISLLASAHAASDTPITVVTFNVRESGLDRGTLSWEARRPVALELLAEADADLIGLQEATAEQRRDLEALGLACVQCATEFSNLNAVLYDASRLVLRDSGVFWLSDTPQIPLSVSWGNEGWPRWVTWARFAVAEASGASSEFVVYNTHLDHRAPESRLPSLELILEHAAERATDLPLILLGDFNARPDRPVIRYLSGANPDSPHLPLADALAVAGSSRFDVTFRSFVNPSVSARLDYVFVSRHFGIREASVLVPDAPGEPPPSDHYPVRAVLTLGEEE